MTQGSLWPGTCGPKCSLLSQQGTVLPLPTSPHHHHSERMKRENRVGEQGVRLHSRAPAVPALNLLSVPPSFLSEPRQWEEPQQKQEAGLLQGGGAYWMPPLRGKAQVPQEKEQVLPSPEILPRGGYPLEAPTTAGSPGGSRPPS